MRPLLPDREGLGRIRAHLSLCDVTCAGTSVVSSTRLPALQASTASRPRRQIASSTAIYSTFSVSGRMCAACLSVHQHPCILRTRRSRDRPPASVQGSPAALSHWGITKAPACRRNSYGSWSTFLYARMTASSLRQRRRESSFITLPAPPKQCSRDGRKLVDCGRPGRPCPIGVCVLFHSSVCGASQVVEVEEI